MVHNPQGRHEPRSGKRGYNIERPEGSRGDTASALMRPSTSNPYDNNPQSSPPLSESHSAPPSENGSNPDPTPFESGSGNTSLNSSTVLSSTTGCSDPPSLASGSGSLNSSMMLPPMMPSPSPEPPTPDQRSDSGKPQDRGRNEELTDGSNVARSMLAGLPRRTQTINRGPGLGPIAHPSQPSPLFLDSSHAGPSTASAVDGSSERLGASQPADGFQTLHSRPSTRSSETRQQSRLSLDTLVTKASGEPFSAPAIPSADSPDVRPAATVQEEEEGPEERAVPVRTHLLTAPPRPNSAGPVFPLQTLLSARLLSELPFYQSELNFVFMPDEEAFDTVRLLRELPFYRRSRTFVRNREASNNARLLRELPFYHKRIFVCMSDVEAFNTACLLRELPFYPRGITFVRMSNAEAINTARLLRELPFYPRGLTFVCAFDEEAFESARHLRELPFYPGGLTFVCMPDEEPAAGPSKRPPATRYRIEYPHRPNQLRHQLSFVSSESDEEAAGPSTEPARFSGGVPPNLPSELAHPAQLRQPSRPSSPDNGKFVLNVSQHARLRRAVRFGQPGSSLSSSSAQAAAPVVSPPNAGLRATLPRSHLQGDVDEPSSPSSASDETNLSSVFSEDQRSQCSESPPTDYSE